MQTQALLDRRQAPAGRPFGLAFYEGMLWSGSWDTEKIYAIDTADWSVRAEIQAPGRPYGMAVDGDALRVVIAHGEEDDRYLYRMTRDGFDLGSKRPCPELTGSFLASNGSALYLAQMHMHRILELQSDGSIAREIEFPTPRCAGLAFGSHGRFHMIAADEEFENLVLGMIDVAQDAPHFEAVVALPDSARCLLYDGARWWTSLRDAGELAAFTV